MGSIAGAPFQALCNWILSPKMKGILPTPFTQPAQPRYLPNHFYLCLRSWLCLVVNWIRWLRIEQTLVCWQMASSAYPDCHLLFPLWLTASLIAFMLKRAGCLRSINQSTLTPSRRTAKYLFNKTLFLDRRILLLVLSAIDHGWEKGLRFEALDHRPL